MNYIEYINNLIKNEVTNNDKCVLYGQNINAGSCLGGLTRNIKVNKNSRIINSTNAENSLVGFGFGLMMSGVSGIFFMKQLDFLLLGIDHLVNTYNIIRNVQEKYPNGSFTIVPTIVDSGYDGPQSSFNNLNDLCSIARIKGYTISSKPEADYIIKNSLIKPGFRIIALSQRLGKENIIDINPIQIFGNGEIFQYKNGKDIIVVSSNFTLPQVQKLINNLEINGTEVTHFHISAGIIDDYSIIINQILITKKVIFIDDSKSVQTPIDYLLTTLAGIHLDIKIILKRNLDSNWLSPVSDNFQIDENWVLNQIK